MHLDPVHDIAELRGQLRLWALSPSVTWVRHGLDGSAPTCSRATGEASALADHTRSVLLQERGFLRATGMADAHLFY